MQRRVSVAAINGPTTQDEYHAPPHAPVKRFTFMFPLQGELAGSCQRTRAELQRKCVVPCIHTGQNARDDKRGARGSTAAADRELAVDSAILFADALEFVGILRRQVLRLGLAMADRRGPRPA
jgi:hypothetical protein